MIYRFETEITCYLTGGGTQKLSQYVVTVEADNLQAAQQTLPAIAWEQITEAGSHLTEAPVDDIRIFSSRQI